MFRIDSDGNVANLFSEGNPSTGTPGTKISADWLTAVQEEICNLLTGLGVTLTKYTNNQLAAVVVAAATANTVVRRDANGRAQFASPSAAADAATKGYVDAKFLVAGRITRGTSTIASQTAETAWGSTRCRCLA